ncbi:MAG: putative Se/S carrier-like protein [Clostridia bacterium]|nr:putative Se/S carrier-like protein [Clostridia bacterium]
MYIIVGSATTAERLKKAVEKNVGFPAYVVHTPAALNKGGCSYSVRLDDRALDEIRMIAAETGISVKRIYIEKTENGESVYHAVS